MFGKLADIAVLGPARFAGHAAKSLAVRVTGNQAVGRELDTHVTAGAQVAGSAAVEAGLRAAAPRLLERLGIEVVAGEVAGRMLPLANGAFLILDVRSAVAAWRGADVAMREKLLATAGVGASVLALAEVPGAGILGAACKYGGLVEGSKRAARADGLKALMGTETVAP